MWKGARAVPSRIPCDVIEIEPSLDIGSKSVSILKVPDIDDVDVIHLVIHHDLTMDSQVFALSHSTDVA